MSERIETLKEKLAAARARLNSILDAVGDRWETPVYADGQGWTVRQIVIHLADADRGNNRQVMGIAEGREVIPEDFDLERYNRRLIEKKGEQSVEEARASLDQTRAELLAWLETLDEAALDRTGRHASLNIFSVEQILRIMASHERDHANDIARALDIRIWND